MFASRNLLALKRAKDAEREVCSRVGRERDRGGIESRGGGVVLVPAAPAAAAAARLAASSSMPCL